MKRKFILIICAIIALSLLFSGCTPKEDSEKSRSLCETFLDYTIQNDYNAAYGMVSHVASEENFAPVWNEMRKVLKDSESYELTQKNWYKNWNNGVTTTEVLFEVVTDDEKVCQLRIYTTDGIEGLSGIHFLDSTEFIQKTEFLWILNIFLAIFSLLCVAFGVWMFVDCLKRHLRYKVLWAIITWIHAGFSVTVGATGMNFNTHFLLALPLSRISAEPSVLAITVTVFLPIGAILYFFMRKRLTLPEEVKSETFDGVSEQTTEETAS
ncbi:MAG: hypothetical protein E7603_06440 [Ruminococcaceae bacterium]|nr:hypothetical protein [Oscillospiraceae bacterium]